MLDLLRRNLIMLVRVPHEAISVAVELLKAELEVADWTTVVGRRPVDLLLAQLCLRVLLKFGVLFDLVGCWLREHVDH